MILERLIRAQKVIDLLPEIIREELINQREFISDLNRRQLRRGEKGDGTDMPNYVPGSKQPSAPGKITLFETGDFYEGIEPLFDDEGNFENISIDVKTPFLVANFGEEILDLTKESEQELRKVLIPNIIKRINEQAVS